MARLPVKIKTLKHLFALTGNQCAFPGCKHALFDDNVFVAQVCHIHAANPNWPRFKESRSDEENRHFSNLVVLCYKHHIIVDNPEAPYSVKELEKIKLDHELKYKNSPVLLNPAKVENIQRQIETFWADILDVVDRVNEVHDLARPINPKLEMWDLFDLIENNIDQLHHLHEFTENIMGKLDSTVLPFLQKHDFKPNAECPIEMFELGYGFSRINWDMRVIGAGNFRNEAIHSLRQLKLRLAESLAKSNPDDPTFYELVIRYREELEKSVENEIYYD